MLLWQVNAPWGYLGRKFWPLDVVGISRDAGKEWKDCGH